MMNANVLSSTLRKLQLTFFFFAEVERVFHFPVIQGTDLAVTPWGRPRGTDTHAHSKKYGAGKHCKQVAWYFVLHLKSLSELLSSLQVLVSVAQELPPASGAQCLQSRWGEEGWGEGGFLGGIREPSWADSLAGFWGTLWRGWGKMTLQTFEVPGITGYSAEGYQSNMCIFRENTLVLMQLPSGRTWNRFLYLFRMPFFFIKLTSMAKEKCTLWKTLYKASWNELYFGFLKIYQPCFSLV